MLSVDLPNAGLSMHRIILIMSTNLIAGRRSFFPYIISIIEFNSTTIKILVYTSFDLNLNYLSSLYLQTVELI